ncbi:MAG: hypothetical protein J7L15_05660 [Clostridiales bacterium]|nr:hypothetical protein [Clostridiales bacterium]
MNLRAIFIDFALKEWLLILSIIGFVLLSLYTRHFPAFSINELQVLFILFVLFVTVNGLQKSGLILKIAQKVEKGKLIPLKLVLATFFLSMLVTNDIALMVIVPLTLSLNINRKDILVILEALAANAGSALTPIGNPQNLYIYWFYNIHPFTFIKTISPFSLFFLVLLIISSIFIVTQKELKRGKIQKLNKKAYIYGIWLVVVILIVFRILPVSIGIGVIFFSLIFDRKSLYIDYALLFSFFFFFGIADNLKNIMASKISHSTHIFLLSILTSQIISNVPATLLIAKFTSNWQALLWGVNSGGFGSLFGSLANLIAYKLYIVHNKNSNIIFTIKFLTIGYLALFISIGLYFSLY